jgi:hypothetical protein
MGNGVEWSAAQRVLPIQRVYPRNKLRDFQIVSVDEFRDRGRAMPSP